MWAQPAEQDCGGARADDGDGYVVADDRDDNDEYVDPGAPE